MKLLLLLLIHSIFVASTADPNSCSKTNLSNQLTCDIGTSTYRTGSWLHYSVYKHDVEEISSLVADESVDLLQRDSQGATVLHILAEFPSEDCENDVRILNALVSRNDDLLEAQDERGFTPFLQAVESNNSKIATILQTKFAILQEARSNDGSNALHLAKNLEICFQILISSCDFRLMLLQKQGNRGLTPLHVAIIDQKPIEMLRFFINKGSDVNSTDNDFENGAHMAIENGNQEALEFLIKNEIDLTARNRNGTTPLMKTVEMNNFAMFQTILHLVDFDEINAVDENGDNLAHLAVFHRFNQVLALLPEQLFEKRNKAGKTPLMLAVDLQNLEAIREINSIVGSDRIAMDVTFGSDYDRMSDQLLNDAIENRNFESADVLLDQDFPFINAQNEKNETASHLAVTQRYHKGLETIVGRYVERVDLKIRNFNGFTPLLLSFNLNDSESALILSKVSSGIESRQRLTEDHPLQLAIRRKWYGVVENLLKYSNQWINLNAEGYNALHESVMANDEKNLEKFVERANCSIMFDYRTSMRRNLFHLSANSTSTLMLLLNTAQQKCQTNETRSFLNEGDIFGETPLHKAVAGRNLISVERFLEAGSNCLQTDNRGITALKLAMKLKFDSIYSRMSRFPSCQTEDCVNDEVICGSLPLLENGQIQSSASCSHSKAYINCSFGYYIEGSNDVICDTTGRWLINGYCKSKC